MAVVDSTSATTTFTRRSKHSGKAMPAAAFTTQDMRGDWKQQQQQHKRLVSISNMDPN